MAEPYIIREQDGAVWKWKYYDDDNPAGIFLDSVPIHAANHTDGTDDIQNATAAQKGLATAAQITKLDGIEALADVTDTANVDAKVTRVVVIKCIADDAALAAGDGLCHFTVPIELNGMNLVSVGAHVYTVSSSGGLIFQVHNLTDGQDMLSTRCTIDQSEKDSSTDAQQAVIDTTHDDVATGDEIRIDVDDDGTGAEGLEIRLGFRTP